MSSVNSYVLAAPLALPAAAAAAVVGAGAVLVATAGLALNAVARWIEDVDRRYAAFFTAHRLNVKPGLEAHLAAALQELGYRPARNPKAPTPWADHEGRSHPVQEVWANARDVVGFARLSDGAMVAYCRSEQSKADIYRAMEGYAARVMAAHFPEAAAQTYDVPTDDGGILPVQVSFRPAAGVRLVAAVQNPARDERCLGPIARVDDLFGTPTEHRTSIIRRRTPVRQAAHGTSVCPSITMTKPQPIVIRRKG